MRSKFFPRGAAAFLILACALAGPSRLPAAGSPAESNPQGIELAAHLRSLQPGENSELAGALNVKHGRGRPVEKIPVVCRVTVRANGWDTSYETSDTPAQGAQKLVIHHFLNEPSTYLYATAAVGQPLPGLKLVSREKLDTPFAGSDFSIDELGLEFLFWPGQFRLKGEMRLGQPCYVLESRDGSGRRVKSWLDKESVEQNNPGLLVAESYDARNVMVKEFNLGGSSFKKIHGQWQLEKMKIRSPKQGSETTLKFDLSEGKKTP
jgi:hypothetical protein